MIKAAMLVNICKITRDTNFVLKYKNAITFLDRVFDTFKTLFGKPFRTQFGTPFGMSFESAIRGVIQEAIWDAIQNTI